MLRAAKINFNEITKTVDLSWWDFKRLVVDYCDYIQQVYTLFDVLLYRFVPSRITRSRCRIFKFIGFFVL